MVFQGPHATLRWPGNERGIAPYPTWQTVKNADAVSGVSTGANSDPDGDAWLPMEMDTTLLDHKWFWGPDTDHMLKSVEHLMDIYYKSVGRGCVLLLNATPDTTGRIPESHVARYREFVEAIRALYANKKGETAGKGGVLELQFKEPAKVDHIVIRKTSGMGRSCGDTSSKARSAAHGRNSWPAHPSGTSELMLWTPSRSKPCGFALRKRWMSQLSNPSPPTRPARGRVLRIQTKNPIHGW